MQLSFGNDALKNTFISTKKSASDSGMYALQVIWFTSTYRWIFLNHKKKMLQNCKSHEEQNFFTAHRCSQRKKQQRPIRISQLSLFSDTSVPDCFHFFFFRCCCCLPWNSVEMLQWKIGNHRQRTHILDEKFK